MSSNQDLNTNPNESTQTKQSSNSNVKIKNQQNVSSDSKRRRNRQKKSQTSIDNKQNTKKDFEQKSSQQQSQQQLQNNQKPKEQNIKKDEKSVHTVYSGPSKDKLVKQKQPNNQTSAPQHNQQEQHVKSNPVPIQTQRKVTITANKSVIVSVLDTNLTQAYSLEEQVVLNEITHNKDKNYSSSLNDKESIKNNINHNFNINDNFKNQMINSSVNKNLNNACQQEMDNLETELEKNYVFRMKKSKTAKFRCNICNYFCDTIEVARKHINGPIHRNNLETIKLDMRIRDIEMPPLIKLEHLSLYLTDFYNKNVISNGRLKQYYEIYYKFKDKYQLKYPDAIVSITGSMSHGVCFNESSCDISIEYEQKLNKSSSEILNEIDNFIRTEMSNTFNCCTNEIKNQTGKNKNSKSPSASNKLTFKSLNSNLIFNFTNGLYSSSYKTNYLIKSYLDLDERARILAFCFRYLAKIAQIDKVDLCTLPAHAYILMTVYFLQKLNPPVLPVLHEICDSRKLNKSFTNKIDFTLSKQSSKRLNSINGRLNSTNELIENSFDYDDGIETELETDEQNTSRNEKDNIQNFDIFRKNLNTYVNGKYWMSQNQSSIGELWLKLLTFYSIDFGFKKTLVSVRRSSRISKSYMKMYTKKISIEDPFYLKQSLSRNLMTQTNKYIISVISKACLYFANSTHYKTCTSQVTDKNCITIVDSLIEETGIFDARKAKRDLENTSEIESDSDSEDENYEETDNDSDLTNLEVRESIEFLSHLKKKPHKTKNLKISNIELDNIDNNNGPSTVSSLEVYTSLSTPLDLDQKFNFEDGDKRPKFSLSGTSLNVNDIDFTNNEENLNEKFQKVLNITNNNEDEVNICLNDLIDLIVDKYENVYDSIPNIKLNLKLDKNLAFVFKFTPNSLNFGKAPPKICSHCNKEGHLLAECPQDQLPELDSLPDMNDEWREVLTKVCYCIMDDNKQTEAEELIRNNLLQDIRFIINQKYPDAKLSLFGSSNNGFAMKKSDLDICMTLENNPRGQEINLKKIIRTIGSLFRRDQNFDQIEERVSAKVPIVKFRHKQTNIEGDISLYNTLALQNTDLLRSYVEIDSRLQVLGHVVKHFAKICRIGDASCGSLSSYAYIVMMLHYLMNIDPPVLPCLQRLNRDKFPLKETKLEIDGWDCWFNRDIANLQFNWSDYKKNKMTVGELWLGFLRYYTEIFDWDNHVVCIRDTNPLTRKEKNWTKHRLAIEDPFELSHNLAAGVSHKMGLFILRSFAKARFLFGNIVHDFRSNEIRFNLEYFFNPRSLVEGNPPMDRNCFSCLKIGHQTKDCPLANARRRDRQLSDIFDGRIEDLNNVTCFKCRKVGHKAKDCSLDLKRVKTISFSNDTKCFNCNQLGHIAKDCFINQGKIQIQSNIPFVTHQQSAPPPKMISIIPSSSSHPIIFHTGEHKTHLLVNPPPNLNQIPAVPLINSQNNQKQHQYQNGHARYHHNQQPNLNRQQSYPNSYSKNHPEQIYHQHHQQYNIISNDQLSLSTIPYASPTNQFSFTFSSSLGTNGLNQVFTNQYNQYHPPFHQQYILYNNIPPSSPLPGSDYKVYSANLGRLDEKNIDLDIVQLNSTNLSKP